MKAQVSKRTFENSRWFVMAMLLALAMIAFAGVYRATAAPPEAPPAARRTVSWATALITSDGNTSSSLTQAYAYHDIFCNIDALDAQDITISIQASPDDSTFYHVYTLTQVTTDTQIFTRAISYGLYERLYFNVTTSAAITPACSSIYFNDWAPSGYVQPLQALDYD